MVDVAKVEEEAKSWWTKIKDSPCWMKVVLVLIVAFLLGRCTPASAGEEQRGRLGPSSISGAISGSTSGASVGNVGGGAGGVASIEGVTGGSVNAPVSNAMTNKTTSYAIGMADLVTSMGDCPVLGSASVAIVATTTKVEVCIAKQTILLMDSIGMLKYSAPNDQMKPAWVAACTAPEVSQAVEWCHREVARGY